MSTLKLKLFFKMALILERSGARNHQIFENSIIHMNLHFAKGVYICTLVLLAAEKGFSSLLDMRAQILLRPPSQDFGCREHLFLLLVHCRMILQFNQKFIIQFHGHKINIKSNRIMSHCQIPSKEVQDHTFCRYIIASTAQKPDQKHNLIQKRACSSLAELSNSICQEKLMEERFSTVKTTNFSLVSPWKSKINESQSIFSGVKQKRSTLHELQQLKKGTSYLKPRRQQCRILRSSYRNHTEHKESIIEQRPRVLKTEELAGNSEVQPNDQLKFKAYTSQQVIHITHPLKDLNNQNKQAKKKHKNKILMPNYAHIECKPYFKQAHTRENVKTGILNKLIQGKWVHNAMAIRCSQKKKLKRMFMDNKNQQKHFFSSKHLSDIRDLSNFPGSNPVSRTLLEKYLLVLNEQNKQNI